jgi:hypothetical protein
LMGSDTSDFLSIPNFSVPVADGPIDDSGEDDETGTDDGTGTETDTNTETDSDSETDDTAV